MPKKILTKSCCVIALAVGLGVAPPAHAGFEWVAPSDNMGAQAPGTTSYAAPSAASNMPEIISPVIISGDTRSAPPTPSYAQPAYQAPAQAPAYQPPAYQPPAYQPPAYQPPSNPAPIAASAPMQLAPRPNDRADLATATIAMPSSGPDIVQGFATQVPLPLALRQILPPGYSFSMSQDVDMNMLVSYKGGRSWRETLGDMLTSAGLSGREQGSIIVITHTASAMAPAAPDNRPPVNILSQSPTPQQSQLTLVSSAPGRIDLPAVNVGLPDGWSVERGDTLHKGLTEWCRRAGVELQWMAEYDYPVEASVHFSGGFEDAVRGLLAGFDGARPQPIGELHTNASAGQMVLVVQARGNNYSN